MPRKPKDQRTSAGDAMKTWSRGSTDFGKFERALGAALNHRHRSAIEFSLALAVRGKSKQATGSLLQTTRASLIDVAETAELLSNKILLSLKRGHARQLHRFLLNGRRKLDLQRVVGDMLEIAVTVDVLVRAGPPAPTNQPKGRRKSNADWNVLVQELAEVFEKVCKKKAGISFATGRPTGKFYDFVVAVFTEIPAAIRPSDTALGTLIKRVLKARKAA